MKAFRRSLSMLGLAALLPIVIFVGFQIVFTLKRDRDAVEARYLARAAEILGTVDARIDADLNALRILAATAVGEPPDWREFHDRAARVLAETPHWTSILVTEGDSDRVIVDVAKPFGTPQPPLEIDPASVHRTEHGIVAGIAIRSVNSARPRVLLQQLVLRYGEVLFRITALVDPSIYQSIVLEQTSPDNVAAMVDRTGRFIARNINFQERVGQLATPYERAALPKGSGFYRGVTWEGLENYTAFTTSSFSGWSMHIAVPKRRFDRSNIWSYAVTGLAGLAAVLVGLVLTILVLREMADRRRAEESLVQAQKMEAVGQLTGGIAHDFNNLLTAIIGGLDVIVRRATDERTQRTAANALEAARRGAKLTSQLLAFSRRQPLASGPVDLQALLEGMTALLAQSLGPAIRMSVQIDPQARFVTTDPGQLELSILNLAVNARDAMPQGGRFSVTTRLAEPELCANLPPGEYVQIEVADTGEGMSEEVRARAFEPFFTTKPLGAGTGLGLSQVFGVVQQSRGATFIRSEPGVGTRIVLILPRAEAMPASAVVDVPVAAEQPATNMRATILVVDDDRHVRRVMVESLRSRGYLVAEASGGDEALNLLSTARPDLLVIDFSMPGRNGAQVASIARRMHPQLKVLIVSGHADVNAIAEEVGTVPLLYKPFDGERLADCVARVLRGDPLE